MHPKLKKAKKKKAKKAKKLEQPAVRFLVLQRDNTRANVGLATLLCRFAFGSVGCIAEISVSRRLFEKKKGKNYGFL